METDSSKLLGDQQNSNYGTVPVFRPPCMELCGYCKVRWRTVICYLLCVLTLGLPFIIFHWKPRLYVLATSRRCSLAEADTLVIKDIFGQTFIVDVQEEHGLDPSLQVDSQLGAAAGGSVALAVGEEDEFKDTIQLHNKEETNVLRYFVFEGIRYIWREQPMDFVKVCSLDEGLTCGEVHKFKSGLGQSEHNSRKLIYGNNEIDVPVKSYGYLLIEEVLNPFYIFQVFSVILWLCEKYYYFAACIIIISVISISVSLYETRKQSVTLHNMVRMMVSVTVRRASGEELIVNSLDLVPGDCILLPPEGLLMPCDAALLSGECMVNESMLTGESVPEMKTPLPDEPSAADTVYSSDAHRRHTLFCGTQIIQAKSYLDKEVIAVVLKTGFCTVKGNLISSILHPKPIRFKFYQDSFKFVLVLAIFAVIGTIYSVVIHITYKDSVPDIIITALDVITIVVPPALPAAMTVGTIYAQSRLKKKGIFCISPPRINVSGKIKMVCFDKTGTLTEEGLDVWGVIPLENFSFLPIIHEPRSLPEGHLLYSLAACHSVTLLNGHPIGDLMDLKMLESTSWILEDGDVDPQTKDLFGTKVLSVMKPPSPEEQPHGPKHLVPVGVLQRFPFSSSLQRMSVIAKLPGGHLSELYMKGAPEMVASLCKPDTVPPDFTAMLRQYTQEGYRVLGFARKPLPSVRTFEEAQSISRGSAEQGLIFSGFLVMKNVLKPETAPVIYSLRKASIRTVMVTGDNMLTAVNVAKSCHLVEPAEKVFFVNASPPTYSSSATLKFIPSEPTNGAEATEGLYQQAGVFLDRGPYCFAMNGKSFAALSDYFPDLKPKILIHAAVFARMSPDQKTQLVRDFQDLNYCVGMCGDGANDCGALKAADVGISLSDAEASVASPFTSKLNNIECVPIVIREGRCSLETSFEMFKYMAMYSLNQFISVLILYTLNTNLGDLQFLLFDLVITTTVAVLMGRTGPASQLGIKRPLGTLISIPVLGSMIIQTSMILVVQLVSYFLVRSQPWFVPINGTSTIPHKLPNYENTALFCVSGFQYLILAVIVSKGYPFRKPLYTNILYLVALLLLFAIMLWVTLSPLKFMLSILDLKPIDDFNFKFVLIGIVAVNFIAAFIVESALDHGYLNCIRRLRKKKEPKKIYKKLELQLQGQHSWPPVNQTLCPSHSKPSR
ncbi:polyamine-transporting ATPase 13A2 isoform X1 [Bufo bufo]|uniref:polyamine-transporting ATPase 13A2 isoform X1 n=2 Tax=Bufo bufo TaxID=8384 RepID=UPI001ABE2CDC|nr:polyamine-transporting ATPase 13A2 isoform X1 [Bufo bufo]